MRGTGRTTAPGSSEVARTGTLRRASSSTARVAGGSVASQASSSRTRRRVVGADEGDHGVVVEDVVVGHVAQQEHGACRAIQGPSTPDALRRHVIDRVA
jgi:hypothetical protein